MFNSSVADQRGVAKQREGKKKMTAALSTPNPPPLLASLLPKLYESFHGKGAYGFPLL